MTMSHSKIDEALSELDGRLGVADNGEVRYCSCDELVIAGERQPCPPGHDCQYVRCRNVLVPVAVKITNEVAGKNGGGGWTKVFAETMEELARRCI
jgi:hypothetical protein